MELRETESFLISFPSRSFFVQCELNGMEDVGVCGMDMAINMTKDSILLTSSYRITRLGQTAISSGH